MIVGIFVIFAIFGEALAPDDPFATDPVNDLAPPDGSHVSAPTGSGGMCSRG